MLIQPKSQSDFMCVYRCVCPLVSETLNQGNGRDAFRATAKIATTLTISVMMNVSHVIPRGVSDGMAHPFFRVRETFLTHFVKWLDKDGSQSSFLRLWVKSSR